MLLNRLTFGFSDADLPEFCGPGDLADCVFSLRSRGPKGPPNTSISDQGIRRLIDLAYHTSMVSEEGRFPTFRVVSHIRDEVRTIAELDVPLDSVDSLRRLAPTVSSDQRVALLVGEDNGALTCVGLSIVDDRPFAVKPGRPEIGGVGFGSTFYLRVEGPGQLRVSESKGAIGTMRLAGGRVCNVINFSLFAGVKNLLQNLAEQTLERVVAEKGEDSRKWFAGNTIGLITKVLAQILSDATDLKQGGAFVFLPPGGNDVDAFDIHCKSSARLDLGEFAVEFWCACIDWAEAKEERERDRALGHWRWKRERLFTSAKSLAGLSSVDGCVVFNRNADMVGFGGKIDLSDSDPKIENSPRKLKDALSGRAFSEEEIRALGLGTRHSSAIRLCKAYADTLVFVISQDGDLRVFYSGDDFVHGWQDLFAWVADSDSV